MTATLRTTEDENEQRPVRLSRSQWTPKDPGLVGLNMPEVIKPLMSDENRENLEDLSTAYNTYKVFQSDGFASEVVFHSRLYAVQKGLDLTCHTSSVTHIQVHGSCLAPQRLSLCSKEEIAVGAQARLPQQPCGRQHQEGYNGRTI
jgi:hypothetical protein